MISVEEYLMGRDKEFPLDMLQARNMADLLSRVNWLFGKLNIKSKVSSGYRPSAINKKIGGAKMSTHTLCAGIDIVDSNKHIADLLRDNLVVFRNGENAMQFLPPLLELFPETRLNMVIYNLKNDSIDDAFNLVKDLEPTNPR